MSNARQGVELRAMRTHGKSIVREFVQAAITKRQRGSANVACGSDPSAVAYALQGDGHGSNEPAGDSGPADGSQRFEPDADRHAE